MGVVPRDAVPGNICQAGLVGYTVPPTDIFACGVCFFILSWQSPPWGSAKLQDRYFKFIYDHGDEGIPRLVGSWPKPMLSSGAMHLLIRMMRPRPQARPTIEECIADRWVQRAPGFRSPVCTNAEVRGFTGAARSGHVSSSQATVEAVD